jgi:hypothetical protein
MTGSCQVKMPKIEEYARSINYRIEFRLGERIEVRYIDAKFYKNELTSFVLHKKHGEGLVELTKEEIIAVVILAQMLGLVKDETDGVVKE